jgi:hypothetical protein
LSAGTNGPTHKALSALLIPLRNPADRDLGLTAPIKDLAQEYRKSRIRWADEVPYHCDVRLYKYVGPERVDVLTNGRLRFTQPVDLNDPFEFKPYLRSILPPSNEDAVLLQRVPELREMFSDALDAELAQYSLPPDVVAFGRDLLLQAADDEYLVNSTKAGFAQVAEFGKGRVGRHIQERVGERLGFLSLAERADNLVMWAHYGACHAGFVLEFDASHPFFHRSSPPTVVGRVRKVVYRRRRPEVVAYDPTVAIEVFWDRLVTELLLTKGDDWAYEQEWRMVVSLDDFTAYPHIVTDRNHLFEFAPTALRRVVIGARARTETREAVRRALRDNAALRHVIMVDASVSETAYQVIIPESRSYPTRRPTLV